MTTTIIIGLLIPLLGTMLGSAFVFMMKNEMSARLQKSLLGFASGVMVAASVWSLLIPAMEMKADSGAWSVVPAAVGFMMGIGFLLLIDELTPHLHIGTDEPEGIRSHLSKTAMLALAVTIHNLPEGMAVGVVFAGAENGASHISLAGAISVSLGIAIQNIPEGAIISMPMRAAGNSRWKSFVLGSLSGVVEPIGAIAVLLLASLIMPALPYMLAFAAGAMFYVVVEELTDTRSLRRPTQQSQHHRLRHRFRADDGAGCCDGVISTFSLCFSVNDISVGLVCGKYQHLGYLDVLRS